MIPAENVISVCHRTPTQLAVTALAAEQVPGLAFALELGADALVLAPPDDADGEALWEAAAIARAQRAERAEASAPTDERERADDAPALTTGVVTAVEPGSVGDRVALDFTSLLRMGEGGLVGSSAKLLALVHGETIEGTLVPARPFRVNAGPVLLHSPRGRPHQVPRGGAAGRRGARAGRRRPRARAHRRPLQDRAAPPALPLL